MPAPTPPLLPTPIAVDAAPGNITAVIPTAPTGTNAASIEGGFPAVTMNPELAGGLPPLGQDFNGYFFLLSSHTLYLEAGQLYTYNAALATAIGGYLTGTILGMADGTGAWINLTPNNMTNPDTGGAGWVAISSYGFATVTGLVGGTISLTPDQYRRSVVVLQGALSSALTINFPVTLQQWLVVNQTTGGQIVTVKTPSGTGVNIPPGGGFASPVGVYGDGTNLYPTVAPLTVAIDQAPTPLTLVERTNAGYVLATYLNQNSGLEVPAVGAVFVEDTAHDGFLRKITLSNFLSQLGIVATGGNTTQWEIILGGVIHIKGGNLATTANAGIPGVVFTTPFGTILGCYFSTSAPAGVGGAGSRLEYFNAQPTINGFNMREVAASNLPINVCWLAIGL